MVAGKIFNFLLFSIDYYQVFGILKNIRTIYTQSTIGYLAFTHKNGRRFAELQASVAASAFAKRFRYFNHKQQHLLAKYNFTVNQAYNINYYWTGWSGSANRSGKLGIAEIEKRFGRSYRIDTRPNQNSIGRTKEVRIRWANDTSGN